MILKKQSIIGIVLLCCSVSIMADCMDTSASNAIDTIEETAPHARYLREIMRELDHSVYDNEEMNELERDELRRRYVLRMALSIERLAKEVAVTSPERTTHFLTEEALEEYRAYAHILERQGRALKEIAETYALEQYPSLKREIIYTCDRCHARFRDAL